jgi:DNA-binding CsgD family transcriptional regulator
MQGVGGGLQRRVGRPRALSEAVGRNGYLAGGKAEGKGSGSPQLHVTGRQAQILDLAARDLSDKEIAGRLRLSIPTIRTQLQRFYKANGVHSRTGAVVLWLRGHTSANVIAPIAVSPRITST